LEVVRKYAVVIIELPYKGRFAARKAGFAQASGKVIVNIDADTVVQGDTIGIITGHFEEHPECMAVTGRLSDRCYYKNFSSRYKHLYMHYRFTKLPRDVDFLYGSIFAVRRDVEPENIPVSGEIGEDTAMGLYLSRQGRTIHFLKHLTVDHHKRYSLWTLLKNDFLVPCSWAALFHRYAGTMNSSRKIGPVFAHASFDQTLMIAFTGIITIMLAGVAVNILPNSALLVAFVVLAGWYILNFRFFSALSRKMSKWSYPVIVLFTYLDALVMLAGIIVGFLQSFMRPAVKGKAH